MGDACSISGVPLVGVSDLGCMRQYVPPKCIVRRLISILHLHLEESLRNCSVLCSSVGLMKSSSMVKPGTGVLLRVKVCFDSSFNVDLEPDRFCPAYERLLTGLKKSLMAFRFLLGGSIMQHGTKNRIFLDYRETRYCCLHFQPQGKRSLHCNMCLRDAYVNQSDFSSSSLIDIVATIWSMFPIDGNEKIYLEEALTKFILASSSDRIALTLYKMSTRKLLCIHIVFNFQHHQGRFDSTRPGVASSQRSFIFLTKLVFVLSISGHP